MIEADGPFHDLADDTARDAWLRTQGFRVLRFDNSLINSQDWMVVADILLAVACAPAEPSR